MSTTVKILDAIKSYRNANVQDIPAPGEHIPDIEQEHWVEVIPAQEQIAPMIICTSGDDGFLMLMMYSIRYHFGKKIDPADVHPLLFAIQQQLEESGESPPSFTDYPLCDFVLFKPDGFLIYDGICRNFDSNSFYAQNMTGSQRTLLILKADIKIARAEFTSICEGSSIGKACSRNDFKDIEDYFKAPGNLLKYYQDTTSTIKDIPIYIY